MGDVVRHPLDLCRARRRRLAVQEGISLETFDRRLRDCRRAAEAAGAPGLTAMDIKFIEACKAGLIKPGHFTGTDSRAVMARRIVRDLNRQGAQERNEPCSG